MIYDHINFQTNECIEFSFLWKWRKSRLFEFLLTITTFLLRIFLARIAWGNVWKTNQGKNQRRRECSRNEAVIQHMPSHESSICSTKCINRTLHECTTGELVSSRFARACLECEHVRTKMEEKPFPEKLSPRDAPSQAAKSHGEQGQACSALVVDLLETRSESREAPT